jgi:hypothetical protein
MIKNYAKNQSKMTPYKLFKKRPKNGQKLICHGGVENDKNRRRGPRGPKYKFFEILQFSTKAPPLFDPKIDPYKWPYKFPIPHKNACTFAPRGVEKCHFLGGRRADRSDRKM